MEELTEEGKVLRAGEVEEASADDLGGRIPEHSRHGRARETHPAVALQHAHEVEGALHHRPVLLLALAERILGPAPLHDVAPLAQGAGRDVGHLPEGLVRLHQVVEGAQSHGFHRHPLVAERGHDHHRTGRVLAQGAHQVGAVAVGQAQVRDHEVGVPILQGEEGFPEAPGGAEPGRGRRLLEGPSDERVVSFVVLDDEDLGRRARPPRRPLAGAAQGGPGGSPGWWFCSSQYFSTQPMSSMNLS